ncbi:galactose oxidase [Leucosporidium creatinivorum]|uniref:Galactose oxidase n=2 Tax=Leucosporidium creatinivorum TaxID=106004 RepID=A0A1Y2BVI2_9BASI|nr:galactose oxidase [Leucosporidium creatinivorum]
MPLGVGLVETRGEVPGQRVGHASVGVGNVLIVWGGDTKSRPEDRQDDGLYLLNLSTKEWTRVKTIGPNPEGRYGHAAAMVGSKFFIFGGQKDDGGFMNDLVWFDLQKLKAGAPKWTFVDYAPGAIAPPKRTGHTTVTHGDCIYVFGGTDGQYHYNDTWCYDTNSGIWVELSCIGYIPVPREGHAATLVDDVMYVFGGRGVDGKDLEDLAAFKITNQRWFMFQNMGPAPSGRSGHAMATFQNKVLVLGGESYTSQRADDPSFVHVLDTSE